jgi:hypothetical protein
MMADFPRRTVKKLPVVRFFDMMMTPVKLNIRKKMLPANWASTRGGLSPQIIVNIPIITNAYTNDITPGTDVSIADLVRQHLDHLKIGQDLNRIPWGTKKKPIPLPPSTLPRLPD